ncbi:tRNA-uridine aminocarboxypropyltransferase [Shewanella gaetbuli]|uniref:tRNA-uridine aminocarboxypropyltransferase n=1 Tax=Shewanella gaetbuli TaxID=220752 RepID=A0A9X1ZQC4_9GAMM|nr:tRNA-uridine aminocarboxypropyltransferase [Shewanella gaetbuli]MCL1143632.1 DTW domain-containing protein [Shewanella gaetbuli]
MKFILLTHQRELLRPTNSGKLALDLLPEQSCLMVWDRVKPNADLLSYIETSHVGLVYPAEHSNSSKHIVLTEMSHAQLQLFEYVIILDSTWQEARKMVNKSPYLQGLPTIEINCEYDSTFDLRRNQIEGGLCTAECVAMLLKYNNQIQQSSDVLNSLHQFIVK